MDYIILIFVNCQSCLKMRLILLLIDTEIVVIVALLLPHVFGHCKYLNQTNLSNECNKKNGYNQGESLIDQI